MKWPTYLLVLSMILFFFHSSLIGYFIYILAFGSINGEVLYSALSVVAACFVFIPLVMEKVKKPFYFQLFFYANLWVAFNPLIFRGIDNIF